MEQDSMPARETQPAALPVERLAFSSRELCAAIGVSPVTLWRLEKRGLLRPVQGIRHKLYAVAEVKRFIGGGAQ